MTLCETYHGRGAAEFADATGLAEATRAAGIPAARVVARTPSTNTTLRQWAQEDTLPDLSCVAAEHQTAGRGRRGRSWDATPGASLTASIWCRPPTPTATWPWLTMMAALAITDEARDRGIPAMLKWPNDVLVLPDAAVAPPGQDTAPHGGALYDASAFHDGFDGTAAYCGAGTRKIAGVLAEAVPDAATPGVVVGFGVNVSEAPTGVPATCFVDCGVPVTRTAVLAGVLTRFAERYRRWVACDGDAVAAGVHAACVARLHTLGEQVAAYLPDDQVIRGRAAELTESGALTLEIRGVPEPLVITAGDVVHLRRELR